MTQPAAMKKDTQRLQRAIVDGLEDVKAQDIQVFNTEQMSPLFERVIVATGSSNRQTRALASSVMDSVRKAGFPKPRIEGEENGEWIIVDCGAAVAHVMQPAIRQYYRLEEIWGDKPVRMRIGAPKPAAPEPRPAAAKTATPTSLRRSSAAKTAVRSAEREAAAEKAKAKSPAARRGRSAAPASAPAGGPSGASPARKRAPAAPARKSAGSGKAAPSGRSVQAAKTPAARKPAPARKTTAARAPAGSK